MSIMRYNLFHLPNDLYKRLNREGVKNWGALVICAIIFWGGSCIVLYKTSLYFTADKIVDSSALVWSATWVASCIFNIIMLIEFPGLFYCYPIHTSPWFRIWHVLIGPIGVLRAIALWLFLITRIAPGGNTRPSLLTARSVSLWPEDTSWQRTVKRQTEIPTESSWTRWKKALNFMWGIGNKRIEII